MEAFSKLILRAVDRGFIQGFERKELLCGGGEAWLWDALLISHFLFADDTLILCGSTPEQIGYLRCILLCFEAVSGSRVNFSKSEMVPIGAVPNIDDLAAILGCKVVSLLMKLPLGAQFKSTAVWTSILKRMEKRLIVVL